MSRDAHAGASHARGIFQLVVGSALISLSAVFVRIADVGPTEIGVYRNAFGTLALLVYVAVMRQSLWRGWRPLGYAALAATFFAADLFFWHRSIYLVGPGLATILGNFQVFFLAAVGVMVFREVATARFFISIPLALAGLVLLVGIDWGSLPAEYRTGVVFGLSTAVMYAGYLLTMRRAQRTPGGLSAAANLAVVSGLSAVFLVFIAVAEHGDFTIPNARTLWVLIAYGVLCQAAGWIIISHALRIVPASRVGLVLLLQPTLTFIWDILFFHRPTTLRDVLGAALALGAIYMGATRARASEDSR